MLPPSNVVAFVAALSAASPLPGVSVRECDPVHSAGAGVVVDLLEARTERTKERIMPSAVRKIAKQSLPSSRATILPSDPEEPSRGLRHRFRELARARTIAALSAMDYLEQLAVRARYHYTDDEAQAILSALGDKLEEMTEAFARGTGKRPAFTFHDEGAGGAAGA